MTSRALVIRRFALAPLARWGFVIGVLVACLPTFLCSWLVFALIGALTDLMSGWRNMGFELFGQRLRFDLVELLGLEGVYRSLNDLATFGVFGILLLTLGGGAMLGLFGALITTTLGLLYNATGRLKIEVDEERPEGR